MRLVVVTPALCAVIATGCATPVNIKVDGPHTQVLLDGKDIGPVPDEGADIEVRPGFAPLKYEVLGVHAVDQPIAPDQPSAQPGASDVATGVIPRSEPVWWLVAVGAGGALLCVPAAVAGGFCLANPAVIGAPAVFLLTGDVGALTASCVAPSWFTLPAVSACGAVGLSPLALSFMGENVPRNIVIKPVESTPVKKVADARMSY